MSAFFPDVLEDTVILLAESDGSAPGLRVIRLGNLDDLTELGQSLRDVPIARGAKKMPRDGRPISCRATAYRFTRASSKLEKL